MRIAKSKRTFQSSLSVQPTIKLLDGELALIKRPNSQQWQCRFKLPTGQWNVASTGTENIEQAKQQAIVIYETMRARIALDLFAKTAFSYSPERCVDYLCAI